MSATLDASPPSCLDLAERFPAYRITMSADHVAGTSRDPWAFEIPCRRFRARIYPHGGERLQAWITSGTVRRALNELAAAGAAPWQVGTGEATVVFDVVDFARVAEVLRPKRKRVLSEAHLALLRASKRPPKGSTWVQATPEAA